MIIFELMYGICFVTEVPHKCVSTGSTNGSYVKYVWYLLLVDIHGSLLSTATYANECIISILNLDMPSCMHCQSIVCQNSIARILYAKIPLLEFHMPIVLYAEIPIAKIQESHRQF